MVIHNLSSYSNLKAAEIEILDSIERQILAQNDCTIREIARINYVSTSTIFKLVKKLGFNGYSEMVFQIKNALSSPISETSSLFSLKDIVRNYSEEQMDEVITTIIQCEQNRISCLGLGYSDIKTILFTANMESTLAKKCDLVIEICSNKHPLLFEADTFCALTILAFEYVLQTYIEKKN